MRYSKKYQGIRYESKKWKSEKCEGIKNKASMTFAQKFEDLEI